MGVPPGMGAGGCLAWREEKSGHNVISGHKVGSTVRELPYHNNPSCGPFLQVCLWLLCHQEEFKHTRSLLRVFFNCSVMRNLRYYHFLTLYSWYYSRACWAQHSSAVEVCKLVKGFIPSWIDYLPHLHDKRLTFVITAISQNELFLCWSAFAAIVVAEKQQPWADLYFGIPIQKYVATVRH